MRSFLSVAEDVCTFTGALSWGLVLLSLLAVGVASVAGFARRWMQGRRANKPPVEGWDLEPWVENPPYAERSCHPVNVDIDCELCRDWLAARNNPPAGVS